MKEDQTSNSPQSDQTHTANESTANDSTRQPTKNQAPSTKNEPATTETPDPAAPKKERTGTTRYDPEFALLICERIATTPQPMTRICQAPDMPGVATIYRWVRDHPEFRLIYHEAKQNQVELLLEEGLAIVDDKSQDVIVTADGRTIINHAAIRRCKMQIEYRQWMASKLLPRKYGNQPLETPAPSESTSKAPMTEAHRQELMERRRKALEEESPKDPSTPKCVLPPLPAPEILPCGLKRWVDDPYRELRNPSPPPPSPYWPPNPRTDHHPKRWYDVIDTPPRREKSTMNKACS